VGEAAAEGVERLGKVDVRCTRPALSERPQLWEEFCKQVHEGEELVEPWWLG
jgi:hypothetical protein